MPLPIFPGPVPSNRINDPIDMGADSWTVDTVNMDGNSVGIAAIAQTMCFLDARMSDARVPG